jgi:hypothetical protein
MNRYDLALKKSVPPEDSLPETNDYELCSHADPYICQAFDLIRLGIKKIQSFNNIRESIPEDQFKRELATIKLSLPRMTGNTTLAIELFKSYDNSLLIFNSLRLRNSALETNSSDHRFNRRRLLTVHMHDLISHHCDMTIIDMASYLTNREIQNVYSIPANYFIFLG